MMIAEEPYFVDLNDRMATKGFLVSPLYRKSVTVEAYQTTEDTPLDTVLADGTLETSRTVPSGQWVVTNPDGEQYAITDETFTARYEHVNGNTYQAKGIIRAFPNPFGHPITIMAPWGELQFAERDCYFAVPYEGPDGFIGEDRYLIGKQEFFNTYDPIFESDIK